MAEDTSFEARPDRRRTLRRGLAVCALALLAAVAAPASTAAGEASMTAKRAHAETAAASRMLIDVRSPQEWRASGLPQGARTVTIHQPGTAFLDAILAAVGGDKDRPIALICASGARSARARSFLKAQGFTDVANVAGGLFGAPDAAGWVNSGLPLEPCPRC